MTCDAPHCTEPMVMQGLCSAHWLEADEAAHGADRIEAELMAIREEHAAAEARARQIAAERARLRPAFDSGAAGQRILDAICSRFWQEVSGGAGRNQALSGAAWAAGRLVAGGELSATTARDTLTAAGVEAGLPWREAQDVVRGQIKRAEVKPRVLERKSAWAPDWTVRW